MRYSAGDVERGAGRDDACPRIDRDSLLARKLEHGDVSRKRGCVHGVVPAAVVLCEIRAGGYEQPDARHVASERGKVYGRGATLFRIHGYSL